MTMGTYVEEENPQWVDERTDTLYTIQNIYQSNGHTTHWEHSHTGVNIDLHIHTLFTVC